MKNKLIYYLLLSFALGYTLTSCTNLDEDVYDRLPAEEFGHTKPQINALMGTTYNTLKRYWPGNFFYLSEGGGSMAVTPTRLGGDWYDGGQFRELYMHMWTARTAQIRNSWNAASEGIATCNATIRTIEDSKALTDAEKKMHIASMRGVRAFWIYVMMDFWGNIPLVTSYAPSEQEAPTNKPRQEVFDWLIQEVTELAESCPDASLDTYGKFTKGSANTLLAKLYLNAEAWEVTVNGGNAYQKCIAACDQVMAMNYYIIEPVWKTNFGLNNKDSREAIFAVCFSANDTQNQNTMMSNTLHYKDYLSDGAKYGANNGVCAQPDYVKLFDPDDPRYKGSFRIGARLDIITGDTLKTEHGRPLIYSVDFDFIPNTQYDGTPWGAVVQEAGARCQKWDYSRNLTNAMENHFHIFRLADIYLMKAEALLRSGGDAAEATRLVNVIRERAYGHSKKNHTSVDLEKVALERKFEFAWEVMSRQDDIRFGTFEKGSWSASNCPRSENIHLRVYPIPNDAWETNNKLKQNPGYPAF